MSCCTCEYWTGHDTGKSIGRCTNNRPDNPNWYCNYRLGPLSRYACKFWVERRSPSRYRPPTEEEMEKRKRRKELRPIFHFSALALQIIAIIMFMAGGGDILIIFVIIPFLVLFFADPVFSEGKRILCLVLGILFSLLCIFSGVTEILWRGPLMLISGLVMLASNILAFIFPKD